MLLQELRFQRDVEVSVLELAPAMAFVGDADEFGLDAVLSQRFHHHLGLMDVDARIHLAVAVENRDADVVRLGDGRDLGVELAPLRLFDVAVLDQVRGLERGARDLKRRDPVADAEERNTASKASGYSASTALTM